MQTQPLETPLQVRCVRSMHTLEKDEGVAARIDTRAEQLERASPRHRKSDPQDVAVRADDLAIRPRVEDEEHESIHPSVALLESQPTVEGLDIANSCLGFDTDPAAWAHGRCIPRPQVARDRKRDFRSPAERAVATNMQSLQQRGMGNVPNRIAGRKRPHRKFVSKDREQPHGCIDREIRREAPLDPAVLRTRDIQSPGYVVLTQASRQPRGPSFRGQSGQGLA